MALSLVTIDSLNTITAKPTVPKAPVGSSTVPALVLSVSIKVGNLDKHQTSLLSDLIIPSTCQCE
jgi:hypothetical protein